jgi:hypothetical protein
MRWAANMADEKQQMDDLLFFHVRVGRFLFDGVEDIIVFSDVGCKE